jgi:hypothetical protein
MVAPVTKQHLDGGFGEPKAQAPRRSARVRIKAMVKLRRRGHHNFTVQVYDLSQEGCKLEFLERPQLDETVWVKVEGLELLQAKVCWVEELCVGVEFMRPIHSAVFTHIVRRLG